MGPIPPFMCLLKIVLSFYGGHGVLPHTPPVEAHATFQPLHAVSTEPTLVLYLCISSKASVSTPSLYL